MHLFKQALGAVGAAVAIAAVMALAITINMTITHDLDLMSNLPDIGPTWL
jgi:hypothetical protein